MTDSSGTYRRQKKSETLEVRLPYDAKLAFLAACREDGTTASDVVRDSIEAYLAARQSPAAHGETNVVPMNDNSRKRRYLAGGVVALALGAAALMPAAAATPAASDANAKPTMKADSARDTSQPTRRRPDQAE